MAQLIVRNLEPGLIDRLKERARRRRRSAEAEHREILRDVLLPKRKHASLKEYLLAIPNVGQDSDFDRLDDFGRKIKL